MNHKRSIKQIIKWVSIGLISSLLAHFIIEFVYYHYDFQQVWELVTTVRPELFLLGVGVIFILYTLFSALFGSALVGGLLLLPVSWLVGFAANLKIFHRSEPLYPNDLYWLREIPFLIEMVGWPVIIGMGTVFGITLTILVVLYKRYSQPKQKEKRSKKVLGVRMVGVVLSIGLLFYLTRFNYPGNKMKEAYDDHARWLGWSQLANYNHNGFVAGFLYNLETQPMEKPAGYSKEAIEELFHSYQNKAQKINAQKGDEQLDTNVLVVMNESFSDPFNLEGIESNQDPIVNYREIIADSYHGSLLVPGFGGGTANAEFQVISSVSLELLADQITTPYIQMLPVIEKIPTIVTKLKDNGYRTTAIHAYDPTYYRRQEVYQAMNFDDFLHETNMTHTDTLNEIHPYISDASIYKEMFEVMNETEETDFLHVVTMQNHGGYFGKYTETNYQVTGTGNAGAAAGYFQDLENSDRALKQLIEEIGNYPEPILLVFWGDHLPSFYEGEVRKANSEITLRETPFFVYSNELDIQGETGMISPIYLNNYILRALQLDVSPFNAMMEGLENSLPVVDRLMFYDNIQKQEVFSREELSPEALQELEDYTLLLYDVTTGDNYARELGFFK